MIDRHIGEVHGNLIIVAKSTKPDNGYLSYYWTKCSCGNFKRYRYDAVKKKGSCGMCEDFKQSNVEGNAFEVLKHEQE